MFTCCIHISICTYTPIKDDDDIFRVAKVIAVNIQLATVSQYVYVYVCLDIYLMHISYHSLNVTGVGKTVLLGTKMTAKPINKSLKGQQCQQFVTLHLLWLLSQTCQTSDSVQVAFKWFYFAWTGRQLTSNLLRSPHDWLVHVSCH